MEASIWVQGGCSPGSAMAQTGTGLCWQPSWSAFPKPPSCVPWSGRSPQAGARRLCVSGLRGWSRRERQRGSGSRLLCRRLEGRGVSCECSKAPPGLPDTESHLDLSA